MIPQFPLMIRSLANLFYICGVKGKEGAGVAWMVIAMAITSGLKQFFFTTKPGLLIPKTALTL